MSLQLFSLALITTIDRAGIPAAFIAGLALCTTSNEKLLFFVCCILASSIGDIVTFYLGSLIAKKQNESSGISLANSKAGLFHKISKYSEIVVHRPGFWMFFSRVFPLTNQFIPLALGIKNCSKMKIYISSFAGSFFWLTIFFYGFDFFHNLSEDHNKLITFSLGIMGLIIIYIAIRKLDQKIFSSKN